MHPACPPVIRPPANTAPVWCEFPATAKVRLLPLQYQHAIGLSKRARAQLAAFAIQGF